MSGTAGPSDLDLIRRFQAGPGSREGREAAASLIERYVDRMLAWCFLQTRDRDRAADLAQDAALEILRSLHQYRGESSVSTWIYSVTRHTCLRSFRRPNVFSSEVEDFDALPSPAESHEDVVDRERELEALLALMNDTLEPGEATALWMRCVEGAPVEHITRALGLTSASGARGLLQTARRKLQRAREARGVEPEGGGATGRPVRGGRP